MDSCKLPVVFPYSHTYMRSRLADMFKLYSGTGMRIHGERCHVVNPLVLKLERIY